MHTRSRRLCATVLLATMFATTVPAHATTQDNEIELGSSVVDVKIPEKPESPSIGQYFEYLTNTIFTLKPEVPETTTPESPGTSIEIQNNPVLSDAAYDTTVSNEQTKPSHWDYLPDDYILIINIDTDDDGIPDINIDTDNDGMPDLNVDLNDDNLPDLFIDSDGDGLPDENIPESIDDFRENYLKELAPDLYANPSDNTGGMESPDQTEEDVLTEEADSENDSSEMNTEVEEEVGNEEELEPATEPTPETETVTETVDEKTNWTQTYPVTEDVPAVVYPAPEQVAENETEIIYSGPIQSWSGIDLHSNRYKLKEAAESMLGWRYSQAIRMTYGYRDCSSFVHTAIIGAGLAPSVSWAWTTYTMPSYNSIVYRIPMSELQPGDIILGDGHVAFYWGTDANGSPMTIESCGTFGVCYGYMMCNGWNFPYTSAWRIHGIDGTDPNYTYSGEYNSLATIMEAPQTSSSGGNATIGSDGISGSGTKTNTKNRTLSDLSFLPVVDDNTILVTQEKINGEVIDLKDLDIDPVFTLKMFLDKYLVQSDLDNLEKLQDDKEAKIQYLLNKVVLYKGVDTTQIIANHLGMKAGYNTNVSSAAVNTDKTEILNLIE